MSTFHLPPTTSIAASIPQWYAFSARLVTNVTAPFRLVQLDAYPQVRAHFEVRTCPLSGPGPNLNA
ncbi:hypothetical protein GCM10007079_12340 [Nocardiopsis terrae]|nr:hypothetical protein GCM10007079_12340 [Nocardiopsis terrae]